MFTSSYSVGTDTRASYKGKTVDSGCACERRGATAATIRERHASIHSIHPRNEGPTATFAVQRRTVTRRRDRHSGIHGTTCRRSRLLLAIDIDAAYSVPLATRPTDMSWTTSTRGMDMGVAVAH